MSLLDIFLVVYGCLIPVIAGAIYQMMKLDGTPPKDHPMCAVFALFWPLAVPVGAIYGAIWCAAWTGRGPVLLVNYLVQRRRLVRLPEARVVSAEEKIV